MSTWTVVDVPEPRRPPSHEDERHPMFLASATPPSRRTVSPPIRPRWSGPGVILETCTPIYSIERWLSRMRLPPTLEWRRRSEPPQFGGPTHEFPSKQCVVNKKPQSVSDASDLQKSTHSSSWVPNNCTTIVHPSSLVVATPLVVGFVPSIPFVIVVTIWPTNLP